jgi:hypothetical protein
MKTNKRNNRASRRRTQSQWMAQHRAERSGRSHLRARGERGQVDHKRSQGPHRVYLYSCESTCVRYIYSLDSDPTRRPRTTSEHTAYTSIRVKAIRVRYIKEISSNVQSAIRNIRKPNRALLGSQSRTAIRNPNRKEHDPSKQLSER